MDVYGAVRSNALFLSRQEKCQKKPTQGALYAALPRVKSVPLRIPRRTCASAEHLNLPPERGKKCSDFCRVGKYGANL